ncbi:hypothetical protein [Dechloromonas sp. A34]|uniref:hypothetical protein n=1 Tax=Dechloromonas sp. A34 TaxID=447588 RepID=UPI002248AF5C|nr:hypothetical protein [Dechloromonas sp. A34]
MPKRFFACLILLSLSASASAAGEFYCCQDPTTGRRVCGDTLPEQCRGRAYRVLDSGGNVVKEVGPPLTLEQKAELAQETKRKKLLEEASREQRRKDQALLDTYAAPEDIDLAQSKAEADLNLAIQAAQDRIAVAQKKRKKFEDEAEFYKKKEMPAELAKQLHALEHEIKVQRELQDVKKREFDVIKAKYDADRKRYGELTGRTPKPRPAASPASQR